MNLKLPLKALTAVFVIGAIAVAIALAGNIITSVQSQKAEKTAPSLGAPAIQ